MISRAREGAERLAEASIRSLRGGEIVLAARDRAARLLDRALGERAGEGGAVDGWDEVARRGRIEHLLPSEHLHEEDEFLRRHHDGEQIYLSRQAKRPGVSSAVLCWDLTVAALGTPRLAALGTALALKRRLAEDSASCRLIVNAARESELSGPEDVETLLAAAPLPERAGEDCWRAALSRALALEAVAVYWIASDPDLPLAGEVARLGPGGRSSPVLFATGVRRIRLLLKPEAGPARWVEAAAAALPAGPRRW